MFFPFRWTAALLVVLLLVPGTALRAESTPAGRPAPGPTAGGDKGNNPAPAAPTARPGGPTNPGDDSEELQGERAKVLGDMQQAIAWLVSMVPIVLCIVGFLILVIIFRVYSRRISEEMAHLDITLARPLEHREKLD